MEDTALAVRQQENQALLAQVVESKMTRGELLDLIVDRVAAELSAEHDQLQEQRKKAAAGVSISLANAVAIVRSIGAPRIELENRHHGYYGERTEYRRLTISVDLPSEFKLPEKYVAATERVAEIDQKLRAVNGKRSRLGAGRVRARNEMVRHALESTPQGARILEAIESFKTTLTERLVAPTP